MSQCTDVYEAKTDEIRQLGINELSFGTYKGSEFRHMYKTNKKYCHKYMYYYHDHKNKSNSNAECFYNYLLNFRLSYNIKLQVLCTQYLFENNHCVPPSLDTEKYWQYVTHIDDKKVRSTCIYFTIFQTNQTCTCENNIHTTCDLRVYRICCNLYVNSDPYTTKMITWKEQSMENGCYSLINNLLMILFWIKCISTFIKKAMSKIN